MAKKFLTAIDLTKNEIQNARFQELATAPSNPVTRQYYFDTTEDELRMWDGTAWVSVGVKGAIVFKGTLGVGGTITALPLNNNAKVGHEYQVITDAVYIKKTGVNQPALVGDLFVCTKAGTTASSTDAEWEYIPSGNDKQVGTITGDGTKTSFDVAHKLNSTEVAVKVYDSANNEVITDVNIKDADNVTIGFGSAPATTDTYKVIILA